MQLREFNLREFGERAGRFWRRRRREILVVAALAGAAGLAVSGYTAPAVGLAAVAAILYAVLRWGRFRTPAAASVASVLPEGGEGGEEFAPHDTGDLAADMLRQGRYALLLRPQVIEHLSAAERRRTLERLFEQMALVPQGEVALEDMLFEDPEAEQSRSCRLVKVEPLLLDRYAVSNADYQQFVDAGGYGQMQLWLPEIWAAVLDFVDRTGAPGPRYWRDGRFLPGQANLPVVGVCWYEAAAYARWVGKRLPSDPEWVKAAGWPVGAAGKKPQQRRYPWGDRLTADCANLWGSGPGGLAPVNAYEEGANPAGVYQLVGNVWEWTSSNLGQWNQEHAQLDLAVPMKSLRGGSYDTYFDSQATCRFQSGDLLTARKHNIGFRCAIGLCDLAISVLRETTQIESEVDEPVDELVGEPA